MSRTLTKRRRCRTSGRRRSYVNQRLDRPPIMRPSLELLFFMRSEYFCLFIEFLMQRYSFRIILHFFLRNSWNMLIALAFVVIAYSEMLLTLLRTAVSLLVISFVTRIVHCFMALNALLSPVRWPSFTLCNLFAADFATFRRIEYV